jgi:hypothetical protein
VCKADARVAGSAFHDGAAWLKETAVFGVLDHVEGGAVFDATAGVLEFGFAEDGAFGLRGEGGEADEGSVADCASQGISYAL